jgi:hypothetical protein
MNQVCNESHYEWDKYLLQQVIQKTREATTAEKIAQLEERRGGLVAKRMGLEKKILELEARKQGATREESKVGRERR